MNYAIIAGGGKGKRFGSTISKQLVPLKDRPLLCWTLKPFHQERSVDRIFVAYPADEDEQQYSKILEQENFTRVSLIQGGDTRFESVRNAFFAIERAELNDLVLIHDAVRPLLSSGLLRRLVETASKKGSALPVMPVQETIKQVSGERVIRTVSREDLFVAQTPQVFRYSMLKAAYDRVGNSEDVTSITDESMLVELAGFAIEAVRGERHNIKVTEREDLELAEYYLSKGWS
jgi:2-C-methyl-D-erythritol 4-phosphate cytidylyltransferase